MDLLRFTFYVLRITHHVSRFTVLVLLIAIPFIATAGEITGVVQDSVKGEPVEGALVFILNVPGVKFPPPKRLIPIDQINRKFVPHILPVLVGSTVTFPNKDNIHHHIYSFSKAKKFERPLYKGTDVEPVVFNKVGIVKLGCNIHDTMSGIVLVLQNPYFGITDKQGRYTVRNMSAKDKTEGIPPGQYKLVAWHEFMHAGIADTVRNIKVVASNQLTVNYSLEMGRPKRPKKKPGGYGGR
ncbi:MAG: hypothetical protein O7E52_14950 [Candidatus Poribacteria bacterium]|nr:hypothetical protein [Candidatus Poribacteria bacterium]